MRVDDVGDCGSGCLVARGIESSRIQRQRRALSATGPATVHCQPECDVRTYYTSDIQVRPEVSCEWTNLKLGLPVTCVQLRAHLLRPDLALAYVEYIVVFSAAFKLGQPRWVNKKTATLKHRYRAKKIERGCFDKTAIVTSKMGVRKERRPGLKKKSGREVLGTLQRRSNVCKSNTRNVIRNSNRNCIPCLGNCCVAQRTIANNKWRGSVFSPNHWAAHSIDCPIPENSSIG